MNHKVITLKSELDPSINTFKDGYETRFVTRPGPDGNPQVLIYLSSGAGCDRSCRMCWLTQQGQTSDEQATIEEFVSQAVTSLTKAKEWLIAQNKEVTTVHFNFMARGEPLLNPVIRTNWEELSKSLLAVTSDILQTEVEVKFKISTIMSGIYERDANGTIIDGLRELPFKVNKPEIYYSLYSLNESFRRRWLPKAEAPQEALRMLSAYSVLGGPVRFHSAFIMGENDDVGDINRMLGAIKFFGLPLKYNIVRYNSPDETKSVESHYEDILEIKSFMERKGFEVQMVERVGTDISASCGQFIQPEQY